MRVVNPICAGMDVHKQSVTVTLVVCDVRGNRKQETRRYGTLTRELLSMADWLREQKCPIAAIESTGVYWKPVYNILESDCQVMLVNPAHIKNVPGRKTDAKDSEWLAELLEHGLLKPSFIPDQTFRDFRDLTRYRRRLIEMRTAEILRVQKILEDCNIKLTSVATDIRGMSAKEILSALLEGKKTPEEMAEMTRGRMRAKKEKMAAALEGNLRENHIWMLKRLIEHIETIEKHINECNERIDTVCQPYQEQIKLLDSVPGVNEKAAQDILAEIGVNMEQFPDEKHLCSWAGMCPGNHESGGKRLSGKTRQGNHWLKTVLVQCAQAAAHSKNTYLSALYRRLIRKGAKKAVVAVGHSILGAIYFMLKNGVPYEDLGEDYLESLHKDRAVYRHLMQLKNLGVDLFASAKAVAPELVSRVSRCPSPDGGT